MPSALTALRQTWTDAWPSALAAWSRFTRLRAPVLCLRVEEARDEGLTGSFAMIRLVDQVIVVSLPAVAENGVGDFAREVLAHEIGHHVLAPGNLSDHARMIARMRYGLPTVEHHAPMVANLYTDLLINDRLQRGADGLRMADVYRAMAAHGDAKPSGAVWALYMRIYELLWSLPRGDLGGGPTDDALEGDATLGARLIRSYARDFLDGSGRFACLLLPHLMADAQSAERLKLLLDTEQAGIGGDPGGLTDDDPAGRAGAIHPAQDPELNDAPPAETGADGQASNSKDSPKSAAPASGQGQARQPFEYGAILKAAGVKLDDHDIAVRYYRERARPHLIPFPGHPRPRLTDPMPEGLEPWSFGDPLDAADWLQSVLQSPRPVPGLTTVQRVWGMTEEPPLKPEPLDLDLYVDSSGSMPNPQRSISYLTLAGAILCLSALRAGARVQVTLWSGANQWLGTEGGFVRDEENILRVLTGFFGGGTAFPLHRLRDTYADRKKEARPAHILVISDDGVSTMFTGKDERGNDAAGIAETALAKARGGGTLVLNLADGWERHADNPHPYYASVYGPIRRARDEGGWSIFRLTVWDELVRFAREFSRRRYGPPPAAATPRPSA